MILFDRIFRAVPEYGRTHLGNGGMWTRSVQLGRLHLGYTVYKHIYPTSTDRWVIQPEIIWDSKVNTPFFKRQTEGEKEKK